MFMTGIWSRLFVFMAEVAAAGIAHAEDAMDRIKQSGKLTVGVKVDYRPFGYRNEKGEMLGLEHDLVAISLPVFRPSSARTSKWRRSWSLAQNRMQFLQQGRIDLMIATMNDTPDRRKIIDIIEPSYYASGVNLLTRKSNNIKNWTDLKGKTVCTLQGRVVQQVAFRAIRVRRATLCGRRGGLPGCLRQPVRRLPRRRRAWHVAFCSEAATGATLKCRCRPCPKPRGAWRWPRVTRNSGTS
jgi:ABC-type amino acid transport substrate-binding protein